MPLSSPNDDRFRGFWGAHGLGHMGLAATTWVPMSARIPYCHKMTTQTHHRRISENLKKISKIFCVCGGGGGQNFFAHYGCYASNKPHTVPLGHNIATPLHIPLGLGGTVTCPKRPWCQRR